MNKAFLRFVENNTALYFALCCSAGLAIRWYLVGQDLGRFMNPFAFFN